MAVQQVKTRHVAPPNDTAKRKPLNAKDVRALVLAGVETEMTSDVMLGPDIRGNILETSRFESNSLDAIDNEIRSLWNRSQELFLAIGRCLINARGIISDRVRDRNSVMTPTERRSFEDAEWKLFQENLPFTQGISSQLECVARAVQNGRLAREELPSTYSVAYQLTTLNEAELEAARRSPLGLVGPNATRSKIIKFKHDLKRARVSERERLLERKNATLRALDRLAAELARIEADLAKIDVGEAN